MINQAFALRNTCILLLVFLLTAACGNSQPLTQINMNAAGLAIKGYDPVAYFLSGGPLLGSTAYQYTWQGATWQFSSLKHLELFKAAPEDYAPQYGGYCAYAVSRGSTADIDPDAWSIVNNKLYLNLDKKVQNIWQAEQDANISRADHIWPNLSGRNKY